MKKKWASRLVTLGKVIPDIRRLKIVEEIICRVSGG
jgi:hypothetical protein